MRRDNLEIHLRDIDPSVAQWVPYARKKLLALWKSDRAKSGFNREIVGDTIITVWWSGSQGYIRIEGKECPKMVSGLVEALVTFSNRTAIYTEIVDGKEVERFRRFNEKGSGEWASTAKLKVGGPAAVDVRPGMFSGEIRKVVQVLLGQNESVPYSPTFATTHGVFVASDGSRHIIEISAEGIFTWPMPECRASNGTRGDLDYIPVGAQRPQNPKRIATKGAMDAAYWEKRPLFPECGWAFSASGHKASNVVLSADAASYRSHLFTISINEADNAPASASMVEVSSDYFYGDKLTHLRIPDYGNGAIVSFDWFTGFTGPETIDCPVYVWYVGEELQEVRYVTSPQPGSLVPRDIPDPSLSQPISELDGGTEYLSHSVRSIIGSLGAYGHIDANFGTKAFKSPAMDVAEYGFQSGRYIERFIYDSFGQCTSDSVPLHDSVLVSCRSFVGYSATNSVTDVITIPINEREAVIHARHFAAAHSAYTLNISGSPNAGNGPAGWGALGNWYTGNIAPLGCDWSTNNCSILQDGPFPVDAFPLNVTTIYTGAYEVGDFCPPNNYRAWCRPGGSSISYLDFDDNVAVPAGTEETITVALVNGGEVRELYNDDNGWFTFEEEPTLVAVVANDVFGRLAFWSDRPSTVPFGHTLVGQTEYDVSDMSRLYHCFVGVP